MEKALNIISLTIKLLVAGLGVLTAADASLLHLTTETLGSIVGGLGTAGLVVKGLQSSLAKPVA